jgi:hypothetical protein
MIEKYFTEGLRVNTDPVGAKLRLSIQPKTCEKISRSAVQTKNVLFFALILFFFFDPRTIFL